MTSEDRRVRCFCVFRTGALACNPAWIPEDWSPWRIFRSIFIAFYPVVVNKFVWKLPNYLSSLMLGKYKDKQAQFRVKILVIFWIEDAMLKHVSTAWLFTWTFWSNRRLNYWSPQNCTCMTILICRVFSSVSRFCCCTQIINSYGKLLLFLQHLLQSGSSLCVGLIVTIEIWW